jgi:hypothetical protein
VCVLRGEIVRQAHAIIHSLISHTCLAVPGEFTEIQRNELTLQVSARLWQRNESLVTVKEERVVKSTKSFLFSLRESYAPYNRYR